MRTEGNKRKTGAEEDESLLRRTAKYLTTLERSEGVWGKEKVVELAQVEERLSAEQKERDAIRGRGRRLGSGASTTWSGDGDELHVFEIGSWEEAMSNAGKAPTTTKWIDRVKKNDDCREFVRRRLMVRDFKPKREGREGLRDDMFAVMPAK